MSIMVPSAGGVELLKRILYGRGAAITGATNATPIVITSNAHGLSNGMSVTIAGVGGNTAANGTFTVASVATNTFALTTAAGANVAGNGSYTSGGIWTINALENALLKLYSNNHTPAEADTAGSYTELATASGYSQPGQTLTSLDGSWAVPATVGLGRHRRMGHRPWHRIDQRAGVHVHGAILELDGLGHLLRLLRRGQQLDRDLVGRAVHERAKKLCQRRLALADAPPRPHPQLALPIKGALIAGALHFISRENLMLDHSGHTAPAMPGWSPGNGEFCLLRLKDVGKQAALVQQGAYACKDGSLVCIHTAAHRSSPSSIKRADGSVEMSPGEYQPARLMLMMESGSNFPVLVRFPNGHAAAQNVFFYPDSPSIAELRPLMDKADLPPGRVVHPDWVPRGQRLLEAAVAA